MPRALNILLVEEDCIDGKAIKIALSNAGIQGHLFIVHTGWECLAFLRKLEPYFAAPTPDVIIVDLNRLGERADQLPDLKAYTDTAGIPVIVLADEQIERHVLAPYLNETLRSVNRPARVRDFIASIRQVIADLLPEVVGSGCAESSSRPHIGRPTRRQTGNPMRAVGDQSAQERPGHEESR